ncbi:MAG: UDP-N-acetylmuramoyl-tripeptide--D-alanyl-D-alanine ligase [Planctomycetes bacterium]|nr:UDP-N-acetylmuramoyl-tripeptide--D-alanyl-D-alanine ligase [Planctomycetota bacterium]
MQASEQITLADLVRAVGGKLIGPANEVVDAQQVLPRVAIDSRKLNAGEVFWAVRGVDRDGAEFVADAFNRGAAGVVTHVAPKSVPVGRWAIVVADGQAALADFARWQRGRFAGRVAAVTGSVGKTTARLLIDAVLGVRLAGSCSPENYNNQLGVPLSMSQWAPANEYAVVELAARRSGEIAELCQLCRPHIGVVTQLGESHLETFGSRGAIATTKAELIAALPAEGLAVLNADDPAQRDFERSTKARIVWVGRSARADLMATQVRYAHGRLSFTVQGERLVAPVWGRHHLTSVLAAVAVGREFGLSWDEIRAGLALFVPPAQRGAALSIGQLRVIDDSYNASPLSMRAGLELLRHDDSPGLRIVACGDMCELGDEAPALHRRFGQEVVTRCGADLLVACGPNADHVVNAAQQAGMSEQRAIACDSPAGVAEVVRERARPGSVVLLKGSRVMGMETCLKIWRAEADELQRVAA